MNIRLRRRGGADERRSINPDLELFEGLSSRELKEIGKYFTVIDVEEGRDLGRRGTECQFFGVVLTGQVVMSFHDAPVGFLTPGCFWGALALLDPGTDRRRRGTASALVDSRIAVSSPREFAGLMHACPLIAQRIRAVTDRRSAFVAAEGQANLDAAEPVSYQVHIPIGA